MGKKLKVKTKIDHEKKSSKNVSKELTPAQIEKFQADIAKSQMQLDSRRNKSIKSHARFKLLLLRRRLRDAERKNRALTRKKFGESAAPRQIPRTIENTRENEPTFESNLTKEELEAEKRDETENYFAGEYCPKVLLTASDYPNRYTRMFLTELSTILPNSVMWMRKVLSLRRLSKKCIQAGITDIVDVHQSRKSQLPDSLIHVHLPSGPTIYYKLSSIQFRKEIPRRWLHCNKGNPELILNHFTTTLGRRPMEYSSLRENLKFESSLDVFKSCFWLYNNKPSFKGFQRLGFLNFVAKNTREKETTFESNLPKEELEAEKRDEMENYFAGEYCPKVLLTASDYPNRYTRMFLTELSTILPNSVMWMRKVTSLRRLSKKCIQAGITDIVDVHQSRKSQLPGSLIHVHLPSGPTIYYKLSSIQFRKEIPRRWLHCNKGNPELILNHFTTTLGRRISRRLAVLFPLQPTFQARQVVTFHNQRDYVFFRRHKYVFRNEGTRAVTREIGPRFTLRVRKIIKGDFTPSPKPSDIEYQWVPHQHEKRKRKFNL